MYDKGAVDFTLADVAASEAAAASVPTSVGALTTESAALTRSGRSHSVPEVGGMAHVFLWLRGGECYTRQSVLTFSCRAVSIGEAAERTREREEAGREGEFDDCSSRRAVVGDRTATLKRLDYCAN